MTCHRQTLSHRLLKMGLALMALAFIFSATAYVVPDTLFSPDQKEGVYVLSLLFLALGAYCLLKRKR